VSRTSHDHDLVQSYLSELDAALRGAPAVEARELKEQITAHLEDALPADASDEQIAAVLSRLGSPAELAADAGPPSVTPLAALGLAGVWLRRRLAQVPRRTWTVAGAIVVLAGIASGYLIYYGAPGSLQVTGDAGWWYRRDYVRAVDTTADNANQTTVPVRFGQRQGFFISIYNPTGVTQTILGPAYGPNVPRDSLGMGVGQIGVSVPNRNIDRGGSTRNIRFTLPGVIPPHQIRLIRVLWTSNACMVAGGTGSIDQLSLQVRTGWFSRTEIIPLDQAWALAGTRQSQCS
jgi:hypothetical protein